MKIVMSGKQKVNNQKRVKFRIKNNNLRKIRRMIMLLQRNQRMEYKIILRTILIYLMLKINSD